MSKEIFGRFPSVLLGLLLLALVALFGYVFWLDLINTPHVVLILVSLVLSGGHVLLSYDLDSIIRAVKVLNFNASQEIPDIERAINVYVSLTLSEFIGGQLWALVIFMSMMSAGLNNNGVTQSGILAIAITSGFSFLLAVVLYVIGVRKGRRMVFEINLKKTGGNDEVKFKDTGSPSQVVGGCLGAYVATGVLIAIGAFAANFLFSASAELQFVNNSRHDFHLQVKWIRKSGDLTRDATVYVNDPPVITGFGNLQLFVRMEFDDICGLRVIQTGESGKVWKEIELPLTKEDVKSGSFFRFSIKQDGILTLVSKSSWGKAAGESGSSP